MPIPYEQQFIEGILACLTNGVITIDSSDLITTWNPAAGNILRLEPSITLGKRYQDVFGSLLQLGLIVAVASRLVGPRRHLDVVQLGARHPALMDQRGGLLHYSRADACSLGGEPRAVTRLVNHAPTVATF